MLPLLWRDRIVGRADLKSERGERGARREGVPPRVGRARLGRARRRPRPRARPALRAAASRRCAGELGSLHAARTGPLTATTIPRMDFETRAIHAGQEPDPATGAVTTPIYQTSTFAQEAVGVHKGYDYARVANPTRTALEECLASLEGAAYGHAFSSGLGAATTVMHLVDPGQRVVCVNDVYGGIVPDVLAGLRAEGLPLHVPDAARALGPNLAATLDERCRARLDRDADEPAAQHRRHPAVAETAHARRARRSWSTTRSRRRTCSSRSSSAPTSSSIRRRSTSAVTPTSIGGFAATNDPRSRSACASCRSRSAPCPGRSMRGSSCGG